MEPRIDWVSSSSAYKKEEIDQPGAPRAKKITKASVTLINLHIRGYSKARRLATAKRFCISICVTQKNLPRAEGW